jgi:hypothetical protein
LGVSSTVTPSPHQIDDGDVVARDHEQQGGRAATEHHTGVARLAMPSETVTDPPRATAPTVRAVGQTRQEARGAKGARRPRRR